MKLRIRASVVCTHNKTILVFNGVDPSSRQNYWFLPGGKIEEFESPWACAERESFEETGYRVKVIKESEIIKNYVHSWDQTQYSCRTYFYKAILTEEWSAPKAVVDADYNRGAAWIAIDEAIEFFSYCKEIQEAVILLTSG